MSRNKDIELLHQWTGQPYSWCRKRMKECHWDLYTATGIGMLSQIADTITTLLENTLHVLGDALVQVGEGLKQIKMGGTAE